MQYYFIPWVCLVDALRVAAPKHLSLSFFTAPPSTHPHTAMQVVLFVLLFHPIALCIADQFGGLGWKGIPLNLTNTRMLYSVYKTLFSDREGTRAAAARATNDVKLFEAVFESMPQLYVQLIVLLHYSGQSA